MKKLNNLDLWIIVFGFIVGVAIGAFILPGCNSKPPNNWYCEKIKGQWKCGKLY